MRKIFVPVLITACILFLQGASFSVGRSLDLVGGIGAGYYYLFPNDIQVQPFYKGAIAYRGFVEFRSENGLSLGADVGTYSEGNVSNVAPAGTTLSIIPVTATLAYHFFRGSSFSPYLGIGVGIYSINESDPNFNYLSVSAIGKHISAGADIYLNSDTLIRTELRQDFIDPVTSGPYLNTSFGGFTASVMVAIDWQLYNTVVNLTSQEAAIAQQQALIDAVNQPQANQSYYQPSYWDATLYQPWNSPNIFISGAAGPTQAQIDENNKKAQEQKAEQDLKRQQYLQELQNLRQQKQGQQ